MQFKYLSSALHPTASEVVRYLRAQYGWTGFAPEEPIHPEIGFAPTLHVVDKTNHIVCVEVNEQVYPATLDAFVLKAKNLALPVLLHVAVPSGLPQAEFNASFARARENGVGVLEVGPRSVKVFCTPLSLSLTGVRPIPVSDFPAKYRQSLSTAQQTFHGGDPVKGCANLYDEIEALCRKIAKRADSKLLWKDPSKLPKLDRDTGPWAKIVEMLREHLDTKKTDCPDLDNGLLYRILGITPHRNDTGHKPSSVVNLTKRDTQLRTRFEHATDILQELIQAVGPLRL